jgi:rhodanese-related sulfurtransferase
MTASLRRGIDEMPAEARARLDRLDAREAHDALRAGAVLVDIRPQINRDLEGWTAWRGRHRAQRPRLAARSSQRRTPADRRLRLHVIVVRNEGYASSLAAAALQNLGIHRATDLVGGYRGLARRRPTHHRTRRTHRHATHSPENQIATGVTPGLARRAVGLKHHDILADLEAGFQRRRPRLRQCHQGSTKRPVHRLVTPLERP